MSDWEFHRLRKPYFAARREADEENRLMVVAPKGGAGPQLPAM